MISHTIFCSAQARVNRAPGTQEMGVITERQDALDRFLDDLAAFAALCQFMLTQRGQEARRFPSPMVDPVGEARPEPADRR